MLKHKKSTNPKERLMLWFLLRNNPSYVGGNDVIISLREKGYLRDVNQLESTYDETTGNWIDNRLAEEIQLEVTEIGNKALFTSELKSESTEEFFDKTFVRWGVVVGSCYGLIMFVVDTFRYIKNGFFDK